MDGAQGIRICDHRMVGTNKTTELWQAAARILTFYSGHNFFDVVSVKWNLREEINIQLSHGPVQIRSVVDFTEKCIQLLPLADFTEKSFAWICSLLLNLQQAVENEPITFLNSFPASFTLFSSFNGVLILIVDDWIEPRISVVGRELFYPIDTTV